MAGTLTVSTTYSYVNGNDSRSGSASQTISTTGTARVGGVQNVGTVEESLSLGDVTNPKCVVLKNLSDTNVVKYGKTSGALDGVVLAGGVGLYFPDGATPLYVQAVGAACDLSYEVFSA